MFDQIQFVSHVGLVPSVNEYVEAHLRRALLSDEIFSHVARAGNMLPTPRTRRILPQRPPRSAAIAKLSPHESLGVFVGLSAYHASHKQQTPWNDSRRALKVDRIPFAQLAIERSKMLRRLEAQIVGDEALHRRATEELIARLHNWWGGALRPQSAFSEMRRPNEPVSTSADPIELLIVRAIGSIAEPVTFGVTREGAVFITDTGSWTQGHAVFVTGISWLLDQATDIFSQLTEGTGGRFVERDGRFVADTGLHDDAGAFLVVEPKPKNVSAKVLWHRIVSLLQGLWTDNDQEPETARAEPEASEPQRFQLVVDFHEGEWPTTGVLREMGYRVGRTNGLATSARRRILQRVYDAELVATSQEAEDYIREWGAPASAVRYRKMARCLGGFAAGARRKTGADMSDAIADWESDLLWLAALYKS